jgi:hypothetical protein
MIDDIVFSFNTFILEIPIGVAGGLISGYSLDGNNFDFTETGGEKVTVFLGQ